MEKNRITFTKRMKLFFKGYEITNARDFNKNEKGDENLFFDFPKDAYVISKANKESTYSIITSSGKVILPESTYEMLYATKEMFIVFDKQTSEVVFYKMSGQILHELNVESTKDVSIITSYVSQYDEGIKKEDSIIVKSGSKHILFDENGNELMSDIISYTTYHGSNKVIITALYKDETTYLMLNHKSFIKVDSIIELESYSLPISVGILVYTKKYNTYITEKYFITADGRFIDIPFRKIEYAGDKICWRVEDFNGRHNYIMPNGQVLLKEWMQDIKRFHYGYAFARKNLGEFYDLINSRGEIIPRHEKIKIISLDTGFRTVFYNGKNMVLAMVNVREIYENGSCHIYRDYQCFMDVNYNFYQMGKKIE